MHPLKSLPSRGSRRKPTRSLSKHVVPYAGPLLFITALSILTAVYYFAIRNHNVELSFDQLSAFDRQVTTIGNSSIYIVEPPRKDEILSSLSKEDWAKISSRIDFVVFVYDDPYSFVKGDWLQQASQSLHKMTPKGYGIVLFSCGCIVPNAIFANTNVRFDGAECTMLPGFVMGNDAVSFVDVKLAGNRCKNRDVVLSKEWYEENSRKLELARVEHGALRDILLRDT